MTPQRFEFINKICASIATDYIRQQYPTNYGIRQDKILTISHGNMQKQMESQIMEKNTPYPDGFRGTAIIHTDDHKKGGIFNSLEEGFFEHPYVLVFATFSKFPVDKTGKNPPSKKNNPHAGEVFNMYSMLIHDFGHNKTLKLNKINFLKSVYLERKKLLESKDPQKIRDAKVLTAGLFLIIHEGEFTPNSSGEITIEEYKQESNALIDYLTEKRQMKRLKLKSG